MAIRLRAPVLPALLALTVAAAPRPATPGFVLKTVEAPGAPRQLAAGDLDGDGDVDLLVLSLGHKHAGLSVLLNGGAASFTTGWTARLPAPTYWFWQDLDLADLDLDGDLDLLANVPESTCEVRLNAGNATFGPAKPVASVNSLRLQTEIGLMNGDAVPDLAYYDLDGFAYIGSAKGFGDGTFSTGSEKIVGETVAFVHAKLGDVTGDGNPDFVWASQLGVQLMSGSGGGFGTAQLVWTDPCVDIALADLDGDSRLDAVVTVPLSGAIEVFHQLPAGGLGGPSPFPGGDKPNLVAVGDMNNDGQLDVVVGSQVANKVRVLTNGGGGVFLSMDSYTGGRGLTDLVTADLDGDGDTDVAGALEPGQVETFLNQLVP